MNEQQRINSNTYPYLDARLNYGPRPDKRILAQE